MIRGKYIAYIFLVLVVTTLLSELSYSQKDLPMLEDFYITIVPNVIEVKRGQSENVTIFVGILGSLIVNLQISECPTYFICTLDKSVFTNFGYATLNIKVTEKTPPGNYKIVITGYGGLFDPKNVTLTVKVLDAQNLLFDIEIYPEYLELVKGRSAKFYIDVFINGPLQILLLHSGCPFCTKCILNKTNFTESGRAVLIVEASEYSKPGIYNITIIAIDNRSNIKTKTMTLKIKDRDHIFPEPIPLPPIIDFNISVLPEKINLYQGEVAVAKINVTIIGPLIVNLSLDGCPSYTLCYLDKTTFTSSGLANLYILTTTNTPPGIYKLRIKAVDNRSTEKVATLILNVIRIPEPIIPPPPIPPEPIPLPPIVDFKITANTSYLKVLRGNEIITLVNIEIIGNLSVELTLQGCPNNSICVLNQTRFLKSGVAQLKIFTESKPDTYMIKIIGKADNIEKEIPLLLNVVDYEVYLPDIIDITVGEVKEFLIAIKKYGEFHENVSLICPLGIICKIIESKDTNEIVFYKISIKVSENILPNYYTIIVKIFVDGYERQYQIKLNVIRPDIVTKPTRKIRKISLIAGTIGDLSEIEENITEIVTIAELEEYKEYKILEKKPMESDYLIYPEIKEEISKVHIIEEDIKLDNIINFAISLALLVILVKVLFILKQKI